LNDQLVAEIRAAIAHNERMRLKALPRRRERFNNERHSHAFYAALMRQTPSER
jgi:hypothetical protein